jgi:hypothetical protein
VGSYSSLSVGDFDVAHSKGDVIPEAMTAFRESDRIIQPDGPREGAVGYIASAADVCDRLDVMGFPMARVRREFDEARRADLKQLQEDDDPTLVEERIAFLSSLSFDRYADALDQVVAKCLRPYPFADREQEGLDPIVKYVLDDNYDKRLGFLGGDDIRFVLRLVCDVVPKQFWVVQDVTELVYGGYYAESDAICDLSIQRLVARHVENSPTIVLAEGGTDVSALRGALAVLYPHLSGYYSFLDLDSFRAPVVQARLCRWSRLSLRPASQTASWPCSTTTQRRVMLSADSPPFAFRRT